MVESPLEGTFEDTDEGLARFIVWLAVGWMFVFFLASLALIVYGDTLMDLFV